MSQFKHIPEVGSGGALNEAATRESASPSNDRYGLKGMTYEQQMAALQPPAPAPQTGPAAEEDEGWGVMDSVHTGLDLLGLVPAFGEAADGLNSLIYLAEGDQVNAALSAAAMIPVAGWAATGTKAVRTGTKVVDNVSTASRVTRQVGSEALAKGAGRTATSLPRPRGIPESWVAKPSKKGGGVKYSAPDNPHHSVRVMPGNPNSPHPGSRQPYVRHVRNGKSLDAQGRPVDVATPEAHIPLDQFVWPF